MRTQLALLIEELNTQEAKMSIVELVYKLQWSMAEALIASAILLGFLSVIYGSFAWVFLDRSMTMNKAIDTTLGKVGNPVIYVAVAFGLVSWAGHAANFLGYVPKEKIDGLAVSSAATSSEPMRCHYHDEGLVVATSGECKGFVPVHAIKIGDKFSANGEVHEINLIRQMYVEENWQYAGEKFKAGYYCVAGETSNDLNTELQADRVWLYIPQCVAS